MKTGETGIVVGRLPPRTHCGESADDVRALVVFMEAISQAQAMDRHCVRDRGAVEFNSDWIVDSVITAVDIARLAGSIETAASV